jgi:hypothetical protein
LEVLRFGTPIRSELGKQEIGKKQQELRSSVVERLRGIARYFVLFNASTSQPLNDF